MGRGTTHRIFTQILIWQHAIVVGQWRDAQTDALHFFSRLYLLAKQVVKTASQSFSGIVVVVFIVEWRSAVWLLSGLLSVFCLYNGPKCRPGCNERYLKTSAVTARLDGEVVPRVEEPVDSVRVFLANGQSMHFPVDRRLGSACLEPTNFECTNPSTNPCWSVDFPTCAATHSWKDCFALPFQKIFFFCVERGQCRRHHHHLYHLDHPRRHGRPCHRRRPAGRCCRRVGHVVVVVDKRRECSWNLNTFPSRSSVALTNGPFFCKAKRFCNCF